jgi:hypothetical protein
MKIPDHIFQYRCQHSKDKISFICTKIKNPTSAQLLSYYIEEDFISEKELEFLLKNIYCDINKYNQDGDTPIMQALMHFSLSENETILRQNFEKIKTLIQYPINYELINVDGENVYTDLLIASSYIMSGSDSSFKQLRLEKIELLLNLFEAQHSNFSLIIKRSPYNSFDLPAYFAKDDKFNWGLSFLINKGLDVNLIYKDEDDEKQTLLEFAKQFSAKKNEELIFHNLKETLEKNNFEATIGIGLDTIEKNTKVGKNKL